MAVLALAVAAGCDSKKEAVMTSGIDLTNLDTTAVQGADFYQYACGGWMKKHPLTNEYSRFGSFDMLAENNREQLKGLIVEIASGQNAQGTIGQKIGDIYNLAMDSVKLNADGVTPIQADLEKIASVKDKSEIVPLMAELAHSGVFPYFSFYVGADIMDSKSNLFQLYQGGISLGENSYCQRRKVGALIVKDKMIISDGYNGTPAGFENCCEDENGHTYPFVLHAEANAITKVARSNNSSDGATLYVTSSPCIECSKLIIQAGISRVVFSEYYRLQDGIELLQKAGIQVDFIDPQADESIK